MTKLIELSDLPHAAQGPVLFWRQTLKNPLQVCSLFPSSPFVGRAMTAALGDRIDSHIIELGAGTGAVTHQLIRNGVDPGKLTLMEIDAQLGGHLRRRFPGVDVVIGPAQNLARMWKERNGESVGAIVSTLPLRLFSKRLVFLVMKNSLQVLDEGGMFVQLTYRAEGPVPPRVVKALRLKARRYTSVWVNIPPAAIWVYEREPAPREI
jgi:phosphatidylethanolamine/phosphatidyl-N-methylethanolamine N-methyltransferase